MPKKTSKRKGQLRRLATPSRLSLGISLVVGLLLTGGLVLWLNFGQGSLNPWYDPSNHPLTTIDQDIADPGRPTLMNSWPLFIMWGFVGLISYVIAALIINLLLEDYRIEKRLMRRHATEMTIIENIITHTFLRLLALGLVVAYAYLFLRYVVTFTYQLDQSVRLSKDLLTLIYLGYACVISMLCLHIEVVFWRLAAGKARIFHAQYLDARDQGKPVLSNR